MSSGKKGKKFSVAPAARPNSDINVTPLVDVVLVLLIIFMVVTPLLEKDIQIKVPPTEISDDTTPPPDDQLIVALAEDGRISINTEKIEEADYVTRLTRMVSAKPKGDRLVFFMAEEKTNYGLLVKALDGARVAGADILGMMTEKADAAPPADPNAPPAPPTPPAPPNAP